MDCLEELKILLRKYGKVAIAYSGGCDSHFLFEVAKKVLGKENVLAILCLGDMMSPEDKEEALSLLEDSLYEVISISVFEVDAFKNNLRDRCYHCKKMIMSQVIQKANEKGFFYVLDGKNSDDEKVYRPGNKACEELGVLSPLALSKMSKQMIRDCSKKLNIVTYKKPSNACLASRFPYNTLLTLEKLEMVAKAEALLHLKGYHYVRVRVHDNIARIEVEKDYFDKIVHEEQLIGDIKKIGFDFVTLDLKGITSGSYDKV